MNASPALLGSPDANGWMPIETAPMGELVDVWVWEVDVAYTFSVGYRFAGVKLRDGGDPTLLEIQTDSGAWRDLYPHENGQWVSHWRPLPKPPVSPSLPLIPLPVANPSETTILPVSEGHSQAKASEDNGGTSVIEDAPMPGEASRASVGAGTDAPQSPAPQEAQP